MSLSPKMRCSRPTSPAGLLHRGLGSLALAGLLIAVTAAEGRAADPLFAHELPRYRSGEQLLADCRSAGPAERGGCAGYVMAVADMRSDKGGVGNGGVSTCRARWGADK